MDNQPNQPTQPTNQQPNFEDLPPAPAPVQPIGGAPVENVTPVNPVAAVDGAAENLHIPEDAEPDTAPSATPNPFFSQSNDLPTAAPTTPTMQQVPVAQVTPAPMGEPMMSTATPTPVRKSHKKLAIILSVIGALIVLVGGSYFGVKTWADQSAKTYAANVKTFSGKLDDIFNNAADAKSLNQSISSLSAPKLASVPLSFVSQKYTNQLSTGRDIDSQYNTLKGQVSEYATLDDFYSKYNDIYSQTASDMGSIDYSSVSSANAALDKGVADIKNAEQLVSSTNFPSSLSDVKQSLQTIYQDEGQSITDVKTAINNGDLSGAEAALNKLNASTQQEMTNMQKLRTYNTDLNQRMTTTANEVHKAMQKAIND